MFWKQIQIKEAQPSGTAEKKIIPLLRHYTVFNVDQCEGIPSVKIPDEDKKPDQDFRPNLEAEKVIDGMPKRPEIRQIENRAYYSPSGDFVNMPKREAFTCEEAFYSVLFHELAHSTGHETRLCRKLSGALSPFGSPDYSCEELVAEIASAFVCGFVGIDKRTLRNSAAYLQGWLKALRNDKKLFVSAAGKAQRAADFILAKGGAQS